ncbi:platelet-derived growth factor receptor alpha isoform X3 [Hermetia illucens]|uniref:platelet-derived growth factor receptor alpha isoform X3 n=1 Tax=Hermetia illucens TaxID=343691 RepID=UPI0018CC5F87|nr:platelet-derived growth factor receptor alpha isoform X3 [Hermetia illucens]
MESLKTLSLKPCAVMNYLAFLIVCLVIVESIIALPTPDPILDNFELGSEKFGAPLIIPSEPDVTLEAATDFTLTCRSKKPVTWRFPEIMVEYEITAFEKSGSSLPHGSSLFLRDVQVENVGKYYCLETEFNSTNDAQLDILLTLYKAETIYLFVNDPNRLLVPTHLVVMAAQYADAIIPCKPSSKNVEVELLREDESALDMPNRYDPKVGYIAKLIHITHAGIFICRAKSDHNQMTYIEVIVTGCELRNNNCSKDVVMVSKNTNVNKTPNNFSKSTIPINEFTTKATRSISVASTSHFVTFFPMLTSTPIPPKLLRVTRNSRTNSDHASNHTRITKTLSTPATAGSTTTNHLKLAPSSTEIGRRRRGQDLPRRNSQTDFINRPTIESETHGHAIKGDKLRLKCSVDVRPSVQFSINWTLPNANAAMMEGRAFVTDTTKTTNNNTIELETGQNELTIFNVSEKDAGYYTCGVLDHSLNRNNESMYVRILDPQESYINMSEPSNHYTIETARRKRRTKMLVKYKAYPIPKFTWYNNEGVEINPKGPAKDEAGDKYKITMTADSILLEIHNIELKDTGKYVLKAYNDHVVKQVEFQLYIRDQPAVQMEKVYYVQVGEKANLTCRCAGYPKPRISWMWIPCLIRPKWPHCPASSPTLFQNNSFRTLEETILTQISELKFTPDSPGFIKCIANNSEGHDTADTQILLSDLENHPHESFSIFGIDESHVIAAGDDVSINCGVLAYNYSGNIDWYKDENLIQTNLDYKVEFTESEYSYKKKLTMKNIHFDKAGLYECRASLIDDDSTPESRYINITVNAPETPAITHSNLDGSKIGKKLGEFLQLDCQHKGLPKPVISWFKNDVPLQFGKNDTRRFLNHGNSILNIPFIKPEDEGVYKCVVTNRLGSAERSVSVAITNLPGLRLSVILGIVALFIVLVLLIIYLCIRFCREKKLRKELKAAGLANFEEGAVEHINPALSLDEQADLLPYDRRFEFPKEKLKLGKQLGAGAFGVVLKAVAEGIIPEEKETTVAVKMVKKTADNEVMKALVSELKIMVHLGQHLNVVNLLGAVTKNIAKREVMVIVEFCRFGNVQNFLLKNRKNFINQINPKTDQIDPSIITKEMRFSGDYEYNSQGLKYAKLSFSHPHLNNNSKPRGDGSINYVRESGVDYVSANVNSATTEMTTIPGDESVILSNNSIQPAWRSNYKPDELTSMDINTTHLVSWAFQVARGMDYLASRKVLHGDLAARNILLCDDNVVKICDFGLARSMYKSDNYKKHGEAPLPIKWLALESMSDQIFSTHSDIWSFGIVLWEFFSLAKVPYPGMDANESLYLKLKDGYRMEKPEYANQELYDIMLECWSTNPEMRPPFGELERRFAKMLGDDITNHYLDLNDPYLKMNSEYCKTGGTDYLALMGCPEEAAPQAPRYVNGKLIAELESHLLLSAANASTDADYVQMNPKSGNAIFSPRPQDDYVRPEHFVFPTPISPTISNNLDSPSSKNRRKGVIPEEVPMLNRSAGSDSEAELSPDVIPSPSKQFSSLNKVPDSSLGKVGNDNYINAKNSDINRIRTKDAFSNPEYLMLDNVNEKRK